MYSYSEHLTTKFTGGDMKASHCRQLNDCHVFERMCLESYGNNVFLVAHHETHPDTFMCMQFLKRSIGVVQLKTSRQSNRPSRHLCQDMKLDSIPLISSKGYYDTAIPCPLKGGFDVTIYDSDMSQLCPDSVIPIRLESECEKNEGMLFKFRKTECIHQHLAMKPEQKLFCIATWTDGRYKFVVLRDDSSFRTWCLRYSVAEGDKDRILAYLFMDFVCDPTDRITESTKYLRLEMTRRGLISLCMDEFHHCYADKMYLCHSDMKPHCPLSCGMCNPHGKVHNCQFDKTYHGTWMQSTRHGNRKISVSANELRIEGEGRYTCVRFDNSTTDRALSLLRIFENGCYPRFVCAQFDRPAPSVLHYRLGSSIVWPIFRQKNPYQLICSEKNFRSALARHPGGVPNLQYEIPQKSQTSVVSLNDEQAVFCNLSVEFAAKIAFVDQFNCSGCLSQESAGTSDRLAVHYNNCSHKPGYLEYLCFASFKSIGTYDRVLTRIVGTKERYFCWVFVSTEKILILPGSECSPFDAELALRGHLPPKDILTLYSSTNGTLCDAIQSDQDSFVRIPPNMQQTSASDARQPMSFYHVKIFILVSCVVIHRPFFL
ncbi:uncharacterized protein LOC135476981 [Liolophura sinensis]|uniref:uncharacterized protein LOC135476981 n=1 Tax=Liolophura sinensis TaxID=3198878 RepID=UPI003158571B